MKIANSKLILKGIQIKQTLTQSRLPKSRKSEAHRTKIHCIPVWPRILSKKITHVLSAILPAGLFCMLFIASGNCHFSWYLPVIRTINTAKKNSTRQNFPCQDPARRRDAASLKPWEDPSQVQDCCSSGAGITLARDLFLSGTLPASFFQPA